MTPGFAKSRKELFWLPYPEPDKVLINAHNFTPAAPVPIGGETGWWCPSLDPNGSGSTLTDLIGSRNGTLTNFALTGSTSNWVADTGSGGAIAINGDGTDDTVRLSGWPAITTGDFTLSLWMKTSSGAFKVMAGSFNTGQWYLGTGDGVSPQKSMYYDGTTVFRGTITVTDGVWHHIAVIRESGTLSMYVDNVLAASGSSTASISNVSTYFFGIPLSNAYCFGGSLDDIRFFSSAISAGNRALLASRRAYQP